MKISKLLILGMFVVPLAMVSSASAVCLLADGIGPDGETYEIGDVICYEIVLQAIDCNLTDIDVYFFGPNNPPASGPCVGPDVVGGGILIISGLSLDSGEMYDVNCLDDANLAYTVQEGDLTDADGNDLVAKIATEFTPEGGTQDCDQATSTNNGIPPEPCIEITKDVDCDVSKVGDTVTYTYCVKNCGPLDLLITDITDTVVPDADVMDALVAADCNELAPDEECCFDVDYTIQPGDDGDELVNEVIVYAEDTSFQQQVQSEPASATVDLVHPSLLVTKSCTSENQQVEPGGVALFEITVENTSPDVCLEVTLVDPCDVDFDCGPFTLEPGDSETCQVEIDVPGDTTATEIWNEVIATWTICESDGRSEEPPCLLNEETVDANDYCRIPGGATRTPGFWKTHTALAEHVLLVHVPGCGDVDLDGCINLGWIKVCTIEEFCAVMWANKAKNTDGSKRSKLCQARMHASFHALAAILNDCVPSGGGMPVDASEITSTLGGTNIAAIKALASELAEYNESGDDVMLNDPDGPMGSATPQECKNVDLTFADCINGPAAAGKGKNK